MTHKSTRPCSIHGQTEDSLAKAVANLLFSNVFRHDKEVLHSIEMTWLNWVPVIAE